MLSPPNSSPTSQPTTSPNIFQSAYLHKSTESALTLITSDILSCLNNNRGTILVLFDMSFAFDTLDHNVLIYRLSAIGIKGIALNWFTSYITNRSFSVRINTYSSPSNSITHGVPQGSVLGPLLFNIYLLPMFDIFTDYPDISFHTYAEDLQLYLNCTDSPTYASERLSSCTKSIHNDLPQKRKLSFSTYQYVPPLSLNHPPSHSTIPYSPTLNMSETLASILIPPFPLTISLYTCIHSSTTTYTAAT